MWNRRARGSWSRSKVGLIIAVIPLACASGLLLSWGEDNVILQRRAVAIVANLNADSERIRAVNHWASYLDAAQNDQYFIVPALGPTPIQVMERGGDCANKSRLVAAILNSIGIDAGLVMMSPCPHCAFVHTVVEAQYENGRMVVDPTWDIDYPTGDGRFLGVADLKGTSRGRERAVELIEQRANDQRRQNQIAGMPPDEANFDYAVSMNWERDVVTRAMAATLRAMGYHPDAFFRLRLLEDPKLFLGVVLGGIAMLAGLVGFVLDLSVPRRRGMTALDAGELHAMDAQKFL